MYAIPERGFGKAHMGRLVLRGEVEEAGLLRTPLSYHSRRHRQVFLGVFMAVDRFAGGDDTRSVDDELIKPFAAWTWSCEHKRVLLALARLCFSLVNSSMLLVAFPQRAVA